MISWNTIFEYQEFGKFNKETIMNLLAIYFYNEGKTDNFGKHIYQLGRRKKKDECYFAKMKDQNIFYVKDQGLNCILAKMEPSFMRHTSFNSNKC